MLVYVHIKNATMTSANSSWGMPGKTFILAKLQLWHSLDCGHSGSHLFLHNISCHRSENDIDICSLVKLQLSSLGIELLHHRLYSVFIF